MSRHTAPLAPMRPSHENPAHGTRRRRTTLAAAAAGVLAIAGLAYLAHQTYVGLDATQPIRTDQRVLADWNTTLAPALSDLNQLNNIAGLKPATPAHIAPCGYDSGELFDLSAGRTWDATDPGPADAYPPVVTLTTTHAFLDIVARLKNAGWQPTGNGNEMDMKLPAGLTYDSVDLAKPTAGTAVDLSVQMFEDGVDAHLSFNGAKKACGGAWG